MLDPEGVPGEAPMRWAKASFIEPSDALAAEHEGVSLTVLMGDDTTIVSWSVNLRGGTWLDQEALARGGAEVLARYLHHHNDFTPEGEDG